jgi:hypothetical protein
MTEEKRTESAEQTIVLPRESLPPTSTIPGPTIAMIDDVERARRAHADEAPTLDACPAAGCVDCVTCRGLHHVECPGCGEHTKDCAGTCSTCAVCLGTHMLSREDYAAWHRDHAAS